MNNQVSVIHALAHALHALRHSKNAEVYISDQTDQNGYIHELWATPLQPEIETKNVLFATLTGALMMLAPVSAPEGKSKIELAVALSVNMDTAHLICASDEDIEVCRKVLNDRPEWARQILSESQMLVQILSICVGWSAWCDEFAEVIKNRAIRVDSAFFDSILATGILPELSSRLEVA